MSKLPQVEDLTVDSDISVFLDRRVPAALRNAALGRMWTLDPTIRDFIEVAENQWNWNVPGGAPFYEPIEAGSGIGEMVAKATNAAARPDMPPQPAGLDNTGTPGSAAPEASQGIDSSTQPSPDCREHSQSEIAANPDAAPSSSLEETAASDATFEHIAAQHNDAPPQSKPQSLPRRHGSALPS